MPYGAFFIATSSGESITLLFLFSTRCSQVFPEGNQILYDVSGHDWTKAKFKMKLR